jgi:HlyD family secretion protein
MRRKTFTIAGGVAVIVVVAAILIVAARNGTEQDRSLRTARVERQSIVVKVTESGEVAPLTVVNVKSELAGEVRRLFVEEGESVSAGDRLALVQQESAQAQQIAQARASVERSKIDLEDTERDLERKRDLYDKGFIAKKDVEDAEQAHRRSQIQHELSEKQLWVVLGGGDEPADPGGLGAKAFDTITVTAPISGVIISLNVEQGEMITSGTQAYGGGGTILMAIADLSKMIVKTNVNEVDVGRIRVGQSAQIGFDAIRGRVYSGVVRKIAPAGTVEGNIVVFPIEVEIVGSVSGEFQKPSSVTSSRSPGDPVFSRLPEDQRDALRKRIEDLRAQGAGRDEIRATIEGALAEHGETPATEGRPEPSSGLPHGHDADPSGIALIKPGMTADLDIIIAKAENVLCLPKEAVIDQDGGAEVMLMEDEKPVSRPVIIGLQDDVKVEVQKGLQEGDEVLITNSQPALREGSESPRRGGPPM